MCKQTVQALGNIILIIEGFCIEPATADQQIKDSELYMNGRYDFVLLALLVCLIHSTIFQSCREGLPVLNMK